MPNWENHTQNNGIPHKIIRATRPIMRDMVELTRVTFLGVEPEPRRLAMRTIDFEDLRVRSDMSQALGKTGLGQRILHL